MAKLPTAAAGATGIAKLAGSVGKPSRQQNLPSRYTPATITGGDPIARSMNHYGKNPPAGLAAMGMPGTTAVDPVAHAGMTQIRGGKGGIRRNPRQGGIGPGPQSTSGPSDSDYSMNSQDQE